MDLLLMVLLANSVPILASRQPQLEPDATLHGAAMTACFQLEPGIQSGGRDLRQRNVHGAQKIILRALAGGLTHLFEEATQSTDATDLVQSRNGVHDAAFVVVVPNVQVKGVRIDVIYVAAGSNNIGNCNLNSSDLFITKDLWLFWVLSFSARFNL